MKLDRYSSTDPADVHLGRALKNWSRQALVPNDRRERLLRTASFFRIFRNLQRSGRFAFISAPGVFYRVRADGSFGLMDPTFRYPLMVGIYGPAR